MRHFGGNIDRAFAADENDAPPVPLLHARQIRPAQAHATKDVDVEEPPPFLVGNFIERLGFKYSQVIDQDVDGREKLDQIFGCCSCAQVSGTFLDFPLAVYVKVVVCLTFSPQELLPPQRLL
jgi:hypothetical protein